MDTSDVIIIISSFVSLSCSLCAAIFARIVSREVRKTKEKERIRKTSRFALSLNEIKNELKALPADGKAKIVLLKGQRIQSNTGTDN